MLIHNQNRDHFVMTNHDKYTVLHLIASTRLQPQIFLYLGQNVTMLGSGFYTDDWPEFHGTIYNYRYLEYKPHAPIQP